MTRVGEGEICLPFAEVVSIFGSHEIRAIGENIEEFLPEGEQGTIRFPRKEKDGIVWRSIREVVGAPCKDPSNLQISRGGAGIRHLEPARGGRRRRGKKN